MISLSFLSGLFFYKGALILSLFYYYYYYFLCQPSFKIFIFYGIRISYHAHRRSDFFWGGFVYRFFPSIFCDLWVHFLGYYISFLQCGLHIISAESCSEIKCKAFADMPARVLASDFAKHQ